MSPAAVDSKLREPVGAGFERAKERIARRRRGKGDRDGSLPDDLCAPAVEDAVPNIPNTSSDARGESSDDGESSAATFWGCKCNVCAWTEAPAWAVHNRYIHTGYRTGGGYVGALRSVFQRHNETCNIWTHLVGLAIFVAITCSMAFDWGRHRLPRLPDTWTFGDESFDATRRAIYRHLRDFASAAEDTRRALVDATEALRRGIGDSKHYRAWVESGAKNVVRDASSSMTSVATHLREHLRLDGGANVDALRRTLDDAVGAMRHAVHGLEHDAVEALNAEVAKLYAQLDAAPALIADANAVGVDLAPAPRWPMYAFLAGAIACLGASTACHTLANVTERVSAFVWRLDYVGIAGLIVASFFPVVYYSFMCMPTWRWIYLSTTVVVGTGTLFVTLLDRFQAPRYSPLRATLFCFLGGSGVFPIFHQTFFTWRVVPTPIVYMLGMELLMGACYLLGAVIYSNLVPERWRPGAFDVWGHSHNIFHVLVVCGAYVHYRAALMLMAWRDHHGCDADVTLLKSWYVDNGWMGYCLPEGWVEYARDNLEYARDAMMGPARHEEL